MNAIAPVAPGERIATIDVVRGFALFGILASNMRAFNGPLAAYFDHSLMWQDPVSRVAQGFVDLFISGKFVTLFSFLFGIGFAIQMDRAEERGLPTRSFYWRRTLALMLFGIAHMFLLWWGDILLAYSLMALWLLVFRKRSQKTLLIWSAVLYSWPWLMAGALFAAAAAGAPTPDSPSSKPAELARVIQVYATGTYADIFRERVKENIVGLGFFIFYVPRLLGIFLFGLWVWRKGIIRNLDANIPLLRSCQKWGLLVGLPLNAAVVAIMEIWHPDMMKPTPASMAYHIAGGLAPPPMSLFYASTVVLAYLRAPSSTLFAAFGAVGRTALTNYLLQTIICTTLYYGYGGGLFGKVNPLLGLVITVVIYSCQGAASLWYVRRFRFGPMEWLWRRLTYGNLRQPAPSGVLA